MDIDLAVNQPGNPMTQIEADKTSGTSYGLFYSFWPLRCPPTSITDDLPGGVPIEDPPANVPGGYSPDNDSFNLSPALYRYTYYRVELKSYYSDGTFHYKGVGDCPINLDQPASGYQSTICFGQVSGTSEPICTQTQAFGSCGVSASYCTTAP